MLYVAKDKANTESAWPAYSSVTKLSRPPAFAQSVETGSAHELLSDAWLAEGADFRRIFDNRLQYVLGHMNHHIHPVHNPETGERRPLKSCMKKGQPTICKGGFL